jgi:hypothetical protein
MRELIKIVEEAKMTRARLKDGREITLHQIEAPLYGDSDDEESEEMRRLI